MARWLLCIFVLIFSLPVKAWVYPEHRRISVLAIQQLRPEYRRILENMWAQVRIGHEGRLSASIINPQHGLNSQVLDLASWPAIAGDHSCSPEQMVDIILLSDWILRVDHIATRLQEDLDKAKRPDQTINAIRNSDIRLQRADMDYATRAGTNNVHFLLARNTIEGTSKDYFRKSLEEGAPLNGLGAYAYFHTKAMERVMQSRMPDLTQEVRSAILLAALANEAFALHFLQDSYAAGHVVGTWGNAAQRKGTHDHYNEAGLEVETWDGQPLLLMGDAYMRPEDALVVAKAVQISLEQLCHAMGQPEAEVLMPLKNMGNSPDMFSVCSNNYMPEVLFDMDLLGEVLMSTPIPSLTEGLGQLPRFRTEMGPFIGVSSSTESGWLGGGFGPNQNESALIASIEGNLVLGLGLDGVMNKAGDGLAFLQLGWRQDSPTTSQFTDPGSISQGSTITSTIPGRSAYNLRVRMPFWLIPGDLILVAPILSWASPKTLQRMAVTSGNGGLIPWQSGISTPIGRFQFVLGREVGVSFYGVRRIQESIVIPNSNFSEFFLVGYRSTKWDFPFLEYQPTRAFSNTQSAMLKFQFSFGVDVPWRERTLVPQSGEVVALEEIWYLGMKLVFHWRHYF
ncbi:hypothetical protein [Lentiprolixibacter aurantiacus]|uniref:Uncharacterized protein n=1 Tax=Lentiprolixibacter aurantiacus TaxID=2993939 RepID=A0AAE3MKV4_9FLAO|nr:hypothetical protein [Lentiprolixibacter aurantiacus]MCX2719181.1 hypothetical protein [Lentiprolixibacter aurantiacus]